MIFGLKDKVVIITGGASGIGFSCAEELLRDHEVRGITLADINEELGLKVENELTLRYGKTKLLFVKTNVIDVSSFENVFIQTVNKFKNVDILINNAGICNDSIWEKEVAVNVNGTINGVLLALEKYIPQYKSGSEGIICNVSSIRGVLPSGDRPIYTGTKFAIHGMTLAWGCQEHYQRTNVKVIGVCPGGTATPLIANSEGTTLSEPYEEMRIRNGQEYSRKQLRQQPQHCAQHIIEILKTASTGTIWIIEANKKVQYKMAEYIC